MKNSKKIVILFFSFLVVSVIFLTYTGNQDKEVWVEEQKEIAQAMELMDNNRLDEALIIFQKYQNESRYSYSYSFNKMYAILLMTDGRLDEAERALKYAYNDNPYGLQDESFRQLMKDIIEIKNEVKNEDE